MIWACKKSTEYFNEKEREKFQRQIPFPDASGEY